MDEQENQRKDAAAALAQEKSAAIAAARQLAGDESAATEFILQCRFADARLEAAGHIHSKQFLERIAQATRDTDRRVARLAQQRLDAIKAREATERDAASCIERIRSLAKETVILPNQVANIERAWSALHAVPQNLTEEFERSRSVLQNRLHEQTALQRRMIEMRNAVQALAGELEGRSPDEPTDAERARLDMLAAQHAEASTSSEMPSLPKNLPSDIEAMLAHARGLLERLAQRHAAIAAHEQAYSAWESDPEALQDGNALRRALRALPVLDAADMHLFESRLARLQARFVKPDRAPKIEAKAHKTDMADMKKYRQALEAMERALEEGALQAAVAQEKELREPHADDHSAPQWSAEEASRLAKARAELSRLKSWARWGGKVSREELIKTAEDLPGKEASPLELAKKIGSLRSQWKSMDAASGPADKVAWHRFDAACTAAYAPAAAHFSAVAAERKANVEKAQALLSQIDAFAAAEAEAGQAHEPDVKKIAAFRSRMLQAWRDIGVMDRRDKKSLDRQFSDALDTLSRPLAAAQQEEMKRREDLIEQVKRIAPSDRSAMNILRQVQQHWQQQAKSMPLDRKDEQALWTRFRAACDELVAQRKADLQQVDAQHAENHRLKTVLCERLESESRGATENFEAVLKEVEQEWMSIGPVARTTEPALEERRRRAVAALRSKIVEEKHAEQRKQFDLLFRKFALCSALEQKIAFAVQPDQSADAAALEEKWQAFEALPDKLEQILRTRFLAASSALRSGDSGYRLMLKQNRAALEQDMLRMEIRLEIESPPDLAAERLKLQVQALQASLKSGAESFGYDELLLKLCELPALHDDASLARIERILQRLGARGR